VGVAGVTARIVQRQREIGIRIALGARRAESLRLVMGEGAGMVIFGAALGFAGAWALGKMLSAVSAPMADMIRPAASNPALILGVPGFLVALAAMACYVPALRATSIDPTVALREE
jgi:ABC-type antimicrobial peptide transport system permease subunit